MVLGMALLLLVISFLRTAAKKASFSVSNQESSGSFTSLDQALTATSALAEAELVLLPSL